MNPRILKITGEITPAKFNIEPEKASLEKAKQRQTTSFGVPCETSGCIAYIYIHIKLYQHVGYQSM